MDIDTGRRVKFFDVYVDCNNNCFDDVHGKSHELLCDKNIVPIGSNSDMGISAVSADIGCNFDGDELLSNLVRESEGGVLVNTLNTNSDNNGNQAFRDASQSPLSSVFSTLPNESSCWVDKVSGAFLLGRVTQAMDVLLHRRRLIVFSALLPTILVSAFIIDTMHSPALAADIDTVSVETVEEPRKLDRIHRGIYAGIGLGSSFLNPDTSEVPGVDVDDRTEIAGQLTLGLDFNKWASFELHYSELGEASLSPTGSIDYETFGASALFYAGKARHRYKRHGFTGFGRLGIGYLNNSRSGPEAAFERDNSTHVIFGFGLEYATRSGLGARLEAISFDEDVRLGLVSVLYRFGKNHHNVPIEQRSVQVPVVEPMVAAPAPAPLIVDRDYDGVLDATDRCQTSAPNAIVDSSGCEFVNGILGEVTFPSGSAYLPDRAKRKLDEVVLELKANPTIRFAISGHADSQGSEEYNQALSKRRVVSVDQYLNKSGISSSRYEHQVHGESKPVANNAVRDGRRSNRRVELNVIE